MKNQNEVTNAPKAKGRAPVLGKTAVAYIRVSGNGQMGRDGSADGYSLPAQQKACEEAALKHGARIVKVYVERAESAKTDGRPVLARMWEELEELGADYLIIHKVDRFARNRFDDADMVRKLIQLKMTLISATENIDGTPQGQMMHGILATMAEFYSNNLAVEVKKGLHEKHANGGTPFKPPIGYLPHRDFESGQDRRSVILDEKRAPLIKTLFDLYETGDWSLLDLATHMETLGLRSRPTAKTMAKPLGVSAIHKILTNPYYSGVVIYTGKRVEGRHEPLVSKTQFANVQELLVKRRIAERASKHAHYLRGTVVCAHCEGRLLYGRNRAKSGRYYEYYSCSNRLARYRSDVGCVASHYPVASVERAVEDVWATLQITPEQAEQIREDVAAYRAEQLKFAHETVERHDAAVAELEEKQRKLLHLYFKDMLTEAVFKSEQVELGERLEAAKRVKTLAEDAFVDCEEELEEALNVLLTPREIYLKAKPNERRALNRAVWRHVRIDLDEGATDGVPDGLMATMGGWRDGDGEADGETAVSSSNSSTLVHSGPPQAVTKSAALRGGVGRFGRVYSRPPRSPSNSSCCPRLSARRATSGGMARWSPRATMVATPCQAPHTKVIAASRG